MIRHGSGTSNSFNCENSHIVTSSLLRDCEVVNVSKFKRSVLETIDTAWSKRNDSAYVLRNQLFIGKRGQVPGSTKNVHAENEGRHCDKVVQEARPRTLSRQVLQKGEV